MLAILLGLGTSAHAAGAITGEQADAWTAGQRRRARTGRMFLTIPMSVAAVRRP